MSCSVCLTNQSIYSCGTCRAMICRECLTVYVGNSRCHTVLECYSCRAALHGYQGLIGTRATTTDTRDRPRAGPGNIRESLVSKLWISLHTKSCPKCKVPIQKNKGCNHITCINCKTEFCWDCKGSWKHGHRRVLFPSPGLSSNICNDAKIWLTRTAIVVFVVPTACIVVIPSIIPVCTYLLYKKKQKWRERRRMRKQGGTT